MSPSESQWRRKCRATALGTDGGPSRKGQQVDQLLLPRAFDRKDVDRRKKLSVFGHRGHGERSGSDSLQAGGAPIYVTIRGTVLDHDPVTETPEHSWLELRSAGSCRRRPIQEEPIQPELLCRLGEGHEVDRLPHIAIRPETIAVDYVPLLVGRRQDDHR